jgi:hypothetical protein
MWGQLHRICKKVCTFVANFDEMPRRETLNNANTAKIMAETFGHSDIFVTLSLSLSLSLRRSPTREVTTPFILRTGRPR